MHRRRNLAMVWAVIAAIGASATPDRLWAQSGGLASGTETTGAARDVERVDVIGAKSAILVVSLDELYARSNFGLEVAAEFSETGGALAAENRQIEAELIAEEKALADQRPSMEQSEFRTLAEAFDVKVQRIRVTQDAKVRALGQASESAKARFFEFARPVLEDIMRQRGAVLVIERETAILSINTIDVTAEAIARINAASQSVDGTVIEE